MINLETLDAHFEAHPDLRKAFIEALPSFDPDTCFCTRLTPSGITPRKSIYIEGKRRGISIRALAMYLTQGRYAYWTPRLSCEKGCINPHHQLAVEAGILAKQAEYRPLQRTMESFAREFQPMPLPEEGVGADNKDDHLRRSFAHEFKHGAVAAE